MFNRLGRKQSKLQIFPLFHTYPFKAENPPPLQLLQYPQGSSGFASFLLQPLKWSPDLTVAQGVNRHSPGFACVQHQGLQGPGPQAGWPRGDGRQSQLSRTNISPASQIPLAAESSCLPSPRLCLESTEVTAGYVTVQCSGGNTSCLVSCLTGKSEQRAQVPINAHKVHECRDGTARDRERLCCASPRTRDQPCLCQAPFPSARASSSSPAITHVPGQDVPRGWTCSAEHVRTISDRVQWGHN